MTVPRVCRIVGLFFVASFSSAVVAQQVESIEINQAIGVQKNNARKFVAGKDTVIRAYLTSTAIITPEQTQAVVRRNGDVVATIAANTYDSATPVVDFLCPSRQ